jgi:hypothetical protein
MQEVFPNANNGNWQATSPATPLYNCLSWALQVDSRSIWPDEDFDHGWSPQLPRTEALANIVRFLELCGFSTAQDGTLVQGIEKIALYVKNGEVKHFARQLPNGYWTSKLGPQADVQHSDVSVFEGTAYGRATTFVQRLRGTTPPRLPELEPAPPRIISPTGATLIP